MEGNNRRIGWLLIGLGALVAAFMFGRMSARAVPWGYNYDNRMQMMSGQSWRQDQMPYRQMPQQEMQPGMSERGRQMMPNYPQAMPGRGMMHQGGWFFGPLMLLGGLLKFALFAMLFLALLKFLRGPGHWGGWGRKGGCRGERENREERDEVRRDEPRRDEPNTGATVNL